MEHRLLKESKPTTPPQKASSNHNLLPKRKEETLNVKRETETTGEEVKRLAYRQRWRFQYLTEDIEGCLSEFQGFDDIPFQELCKYIVNNSKEKELVICLYKPRSYHWFEQFPFIKQDSIKQVEEGLFFSAQGAAREMGPGFSILYDQNAVKKDKKKKSESSSSRKNNSPSRPKKKKEKGQQETKTLDDQDESEVEASPDLQTPDPKDTENLDQRIHQRKLISDWLLRIFRGETIDQIKKGIGKKGDPNLAWTFMQNLDFLEKAQFKNNNNLFDSNKEQILRKRQHEEDEKEYEEDSFKKLLIKEIEEGDDNHKKVLRREGREENNNRKKEVQANSQEHQILADSIAFYMSTAHFKETIASLPLFKKELAAFEKTLDPKEVKIIENAMKTGFNPIHYIFKYKNGEKTLASIRNGIYKKCVNAPSLEIIYRYCARHLQKKEFEEESNEDDQETEPSIEDEST